MLLRIKYLYIHVLTIALFIFFYLNGHIVELCISYSSMLLHELSHLIAARIIGLNISRFVLYPFGVNLKLKNKMLANISDDIILYLSGPATNALIALTAIFLHNFIYNSFFIYRVNIMLFCINLLPILPLDGGCILKRIISYKLGTKKAHHIMKAISIVLSFILILCGVYVVYITKYNYSVLIMAFFMTGNIFTQKEKYNTEYLRELMFYRNKSLKNAKLKIVKKHEDPRKIAEDFLPCQYNIICCLDDNGSISDIVSETQIINEVLRKK